MSRNLFEETDSDVFVMNYCAATGNIQNPSFKLFENIKREIIGYIWMHLTQRRIHAVVPFCYEQNRLGSARRTASR